MMQQHATSLTRKQPAGSSRAAIYARVSFAQQAERHTIDSQVSDLLARAAADGRARNFASSTTVTAAPVWSGRLWSACAT
jgi:predicted site-specific integrase-resolvase